VRRELWRGHPRVFHALDTDRDGRVSRRELLQGIGPTAYEALNAGHRVRAAARYRHETGDPEVPHIGLVRSADEVAEWKRRAAKLLEGTWVGKLLGLQDKPSETPLPPTPSSEAQGFRDVFEEAGKPVSPADMNLETGEPGKYDAAFKLLEQLDRIWPGRSKEHDGVWVSDDQGKPILNVGITVDNGARGSISETDYARIFRALASSGDRRYIGPYVYIRSGFYSMVNALPGAGRILLAPAYSADATPYNLRGLQGPSPSCVASTDTGRGGGGG